VKELRKEAKKEGIKKYYSMRKDELCRSLKKDCSGDFSKESFYNQLENPEKVLNEIFKRSTLHTITPGILTVSAYANFYPVCYKKGNALKGIDVDIMKEFAKKLKLKIRFIEKPNFNDIWLDPIKGVSDVAIGGIGITKSRTHQLTEWTIPYFYVKRTLIYNKKDPVLNFPRDVSKTVLGTVGSTGWLDAVERMQKAGKRHLLEPGTTDEEDIKMLLRGEVQGLVRGSFVGKSIVKKYPSLGMVEAWNIEPDLIVKDGEVFSYPCNVKSRIGVLLSVLITEDIMNSELKHLIKRHDLV